MRVPRAMSTQHPDNAFPAPFAENGVLKGEGEIDEANWAWSKLLCDEQMWDYEGKGADVDVIMKLLLRDPEYFRSHVLGSDVFLTLRIPNPSAEREMRKKLEEALHTIVTSYDIAAGFHDTSLPPIWEVILPFTTSADELLRVEAYYREVVAGKQDHDLPGRMKVRDWLGEYHPESINVIPLLEDEVRLQQADTIVETYLHGLGREVPRMRVFLARSDPALNYGLVGAVLLTKLALQRLHRLEARLGIPIYPIVGVGGAPFRGNFRPGGVGRFLREYPSVQTFTIQSSFKYDYDPAEVSGAVQEILAHRRHEPTPIEEDRALDILQRSKKRYQQQVVKLADMVNAVAASVPQRRDRRLHIGLFGYSREAGDGTQGVVLPRAITFAAALYSLGIPPELLALDALTEDDLAFLRVVAPHIFDDLNDALRYANEESVGRVLGPEAVAALHRFSPGPDQEHQGFTDFIFSWVQQGFDLSKARDVVEWAARRRQFLG
jgi:phosphoenolpyruvate carboxylase